MTNLDTLCPTRAAIETALDAGNLWAAMRGGAYWRCRRNGATRTWKTRPTHWLTPFKVGFRECGRLDHDTLVAFRSSPDWRSAHFVIAEVDPRY